MERSLGYWKKCLCEYNLFPLTYMHFVLPLVIFKLFLCQMVVWRGWNSISWRWHFYQKLERNCRYLRNGTPPYFVRTRWVVRPGSNLHGVSGMGIDLFPLVKVMSYKVLSKLYITEYYRLLVLYIRAGKISVWLS